MSNPAVVPASAPGSYGICIAFGQAWSTTSATWTRLDDPTVAVHRHKIAAPHNTNCVAGWSTDRGRAYELDKTQAGTATIKLVDPNGLFDPTNPNSPFYGKITPMLRAKISVQNPSNLLYYDIFTGFVEQWSWTMDTAEKVMIVTVNLVDGFEPLTRAELQPESTGVTTLPGSIGGDVQSRIDDLLTFGGWPLDPGDNSWRQINTGNVSLQETVYNPETSILSAIQDAADAEFPGVANFFMAKNGAATFYGRYPRFQPTNFPQDVNFWQVGDAGGADAFGAARISDIQWQMDQKNLINACLSYPFGILQREIPGQLYANGDSIALYGVRTLSLSDLIVDSQPLSVSQPAATGLETCLFYAQYYVENYKLPQLRIGRLEFRSRGSGDSQTWKFLTGVEIGDILTVFTSDPGGGGFGKQTDNEGIVSQFFVEGIHNQVDPLRSDFPAWVMTVDVSPRQWFTTMPWAN